MIKPNILNKYFKAHKTGNLFAIFFIGFSSQQFKASV